MVARMQSDKGVSILHSSQFNYGGVAVDAITPEMAREIFNYSIEKKPCMTEEGEVIPRMYYLRRSDGGIVNANCSVGDEFEITAQPMETLEFAEFIMSRVPGLQLETCATMYNGGSSFVCLSQGGEWLVRGDNSPHRSNVLLCNPLTRGRVHLVSHCVRVVCMNTLQAAMTSGEGFRISHTKNARVMMEKALELIRNELTEGENLRQKCEFLASKSISVSQVNTLMETLYPLPALRKGVNEGALTRVQNIRAEVMNQFESDTSFTDKTFYTFLNANTYMMEHPAHKQARVDNAQVAFENIIGSRANRKGEMLAAVMAMANGGEYGGNGAEVIEAEYKIVG